MNAVASGLMGSFAGRAAQKTGQRMKTALQVAGAIMGLIGGIGAGIFGGLLITAGWMSINENARHWLSSAGSTLLELTIPLIILGGWCLDLLERNQPRKAGHTPSREGDGKQ